MPPLDTFYALFKQVIKLVSDTPGSLVYHLVLLFVFQMAAAIAFSQWRKGGAEARLFWAAAGLFGVRLILLIATLLAAAGFVPFLLVIPPLDRAASAITIILILWAFAFPKPSRLADAFTAMLVLVVFIGLGVSWALWAQEIPPLGTRLHFNGSVQESVWEGAQVALLFLGGLLLMVRRRPDWHIGVGLAVLLFVGHALYLYPSFEGDVPGLIRLIEIIALPMFTALVYRQSRVPVPAATNVRTFVPVQPPAATLVTPSAVNARALVALASLTAAANLEKRRQNLTLALAHLFQADLGLLVSPPAIVGVAPVACCYRVARGQFISRPALPLEDFPTVAAALQGGEAVRLTLDQNEIELRGLVAGVGLDGVSQALIAPLMPSKDFHYGVVVLVASATRLAWTADDQKLLGALAQSLAMVFDAADQMESLAHEARAQETRADGAEKQKRIVQETADKLMVELAQAQTVSLQLTEQLKQSQAEVDRQRQELAGLTPDEAAQRAMVQELARLRTEVEAAGRLSEERNRLEVELEAAQESAVALTLLEMQFKALSTETQTLRDAKAGLEAELDVLRASLQAAETQLQAMSAPDQAAASSSVQDEAVHHRTAQLRLELEMARMELQQAAGLQAEWLEEATTAQETQVMLAAVQSELAEKEAALQQLANRQPPGEAEASAELERLRAQLQQALERCASLEKAGQDQQAQAQEAQAALAAARAAIAGQAATVVSLQRQLVDKAREAAEARVGGLAAMPGQAEAARTALETAASLAQDLRQPIMSISGYVSLLRGEAGGMVAPVQKKFLERIQASCERLETVLNDLALATETEAAVTPLAPAAVDVGQTVEAALQDSDALLREKGIKLRLDVDDDLPVIQADPAALRRVLSCLMHNAVSASALNGEVGLVVRRETQVSKDDGRTDCLFLSVKDSGGGITPEELPKVFAALPRPDLPIAGLGDAGGELATLQPLVEAHHGRIWVSSEPGRGSTFSVLLPITEIPAEVLAEADSAEPAEPPLPIPKDLDFLVLPPD